MSGHMGPETPDSENFTDGKQLPEDSGYMSGYSGRLCPDIPYKCPDTPGFEFHKKAVCSGRFDFHSFCRFS
jgi:hypothetical protein